jgi:hypothetical protein
MLPVRKSGGPGKEVPPEESKNDLEKKGTVRSRRNCREKRGDPARNCWETPLPSTRRRHANAACASPSERRELHPNRPIDGQKGTDDEAGDVKS